ncbi:SDR family oxidoreductase [Luteolibacter flavescens]|uniref:SDR family oxidoreductase n=1 Tax=Luteolibacter flavescens TaxID=1859460 RepID=A0ABT3FS89_9BACT|nr:SDR family oxidoreductase [Luteolibacter flavescens]MCW1886451.1 SDR family oxidoreductase [Luteolibacter flavescens]
MIAITGATGQLGRLVIDHLLARVPASNLVAIVRDPAKAADIAARGVTVRQADYSDPASLATALSGIEKLLLISSNEVGNRTNQHAHVIDAAKSAGVKFLAYTSVLHADRSQLGLAEEHRQTEAYLTASGLPFAILRNGWYTENYAASIPTALAHGALVGGADEGRISSAARTDYAEAAAIVLTRPVEPGSIYELAGDSAYTLADLAAEVSRQSGKDIPYRDLTEEAYRTLLIGAGLPEAFASLLADSDAAASRGALFDDSGELGTLLGRPTTPLAETVRQTLGKD